MPINKGREKVLERAQKHFSRKKSVDARPFVHARIPPTPRRRSEAPVLFILESTRSQSPALKKKTNQHGRPLTDALTFMFGVYKQGKDRGFLRISHQKSDDFSALFNDPITAWVNEHGGQSFWRNAQFCQLRQREMVFAHAGADRKKRRNIAG